MVRGARWRSKTLSPQKPVTSSHVMSPYLSGQKICKIVSIRCKQLFASQNPEFITLLVSAQNDRNRDKNWTVPDAI